MKIRLEEESDSSHPQRSKRQKLPSHDSSSSAAAFVLQPLTQQAVREEETCPHVENDFSKLSILHPHAAVADAIRLSATWPSSEHHRETQPLDRSLPSASSPFPSPSDVTAAIEDGDDAVPIIFPSPYYPNSSDYFEADDDWMTHTSTLWLYHRPDRSYYHVDTNAFYQYDPETSTFRRMEEGPQRDTAQGDAADRSHGVNDVGGERVSLVDRSHAVGEDQLSSKSYQGGGEERGDPETEDEDAAFLLLDFAKDISLSTSELVSGVHRHSGSECRYITSELLPLDVVSDSQACCLLTALFDGHGGHTCADYCKKHLVTNLVTSFRQAKETISRKLRRAETVPGRMARCTVTTADLGLEYSLDVEALKRGLQKAFQMTNHNYLNIAEGKGYTDGCTALVVLVYGPDEDGTLKIITAHAGDAGAVLCREQSAVRLTMDHKPEEKTERERIEAAGGSVICVHDVWRVAAPVGKKLPALAASRSIGDLHMKRPKEIVKSVPEVGIIDVDFERDGFLILGSGGLFKSVSDQEACDAVMHVFTKSGSSKEAADALTELSTRRDGTDNKTVTVALFAWGSQSVSPAKQE